MKKTPDEAAYLESQANRLERFVDFSRPAAAVFPNLKPSTARVTLRMPSWLLDPPYQGIRRPVYRRA